MIEKYINRYDEMKTNLGERSLLASKIQERNTQPHSDISSWESFNSELHDGWREHVKSEEIN